MTFAVPILTWVHISDVHMGHRAPAQKWDQQAVLKALAADAKLLPSENDIPKPNLILFTGDIAFSGATLNSEEYRLATDWLDSFRSLFGLDRDRVFFVPGNHDVQRKVAKPAQKSVWLKSLRAGDEALDVDKARETPQVERFLRERFASFLSFAKEYNPTCASHLSWSKDFLVDPGGDLQEASAGSPGEGMPVRLLGLNTALLSQDDNDKERLRLDAETVAGLNLPESGEQSLVITLTHHPLSWLAPQERERLGRAIRSGHIHLCGHVHEAEGDESRRGWEDHGFVRLVAGAAYGDNPPVIEGIRIPRGHGYSFGMIARTADGLKLRVWWRRWSDQQGSFVPHSDILPRSALFQEFELEPSEKIARRLPKHSLPPSEQTPGRLNFEDWHAYVPKRVFLASEGFSKPLIDQFEEHLQNSERYSYKGDTALTTSVQLLKWLDNPARKVHDIKFLLAMPRIEVMKQRGMAEYSDSIQLSTLDVYQDMVDQVFVTLFGFNEMRAKLRQAESIEVGFFSEEPYARTEILDKGLYLTYYRLGGQFGTTLYYYKDSLISQTLRGYFNLTMDASPYRIRLKRESVKIEGLAGPAPATLDELIESIDGKHRGLAHFAPLWSKRVNKLRERVWST
jgi:predicted MPP superfamily phosphohydrolase